MAVPKLALEPSPHSLAFRGLVRILRADPTLRKVVRTWFVWDGSPDDAMEPCEATCPSLALAPAASADRWLGPSGFTGDLVVNLELLVAGSRVDDALDLYHAVKRAVYPEDDAKRTAVRAALVAAGVVTGEPEFAGDAAPEVLAGASLLGLAARVRLPLDLFLNP
jgi:hypothetical protein